MGSFIYLSVCTWLRAGLHCVEENKAFFKKCTCKRDTIPLAVFDGALFFTFCIAQPCLYVRVIRKYCELSRIAGSRVCILWYVYAASLDGCRASVALGSVDLLAFFFTCFQARGVTLSIHVSLVS